MRNIFDFIDKTVLVTGGAGSGGAQSGRIISEFFAECGANVIACDIDGEGVRSVAEKAAKRGGAILGIECDICDEEQVDRMASVVSDSFGGLDILVNNAFWHADLQPNVADTDLAEWDKHIEINLRAPFVVTKRFLPLLMRRDSSCIVNVGTTGAHRGEDGYAAYSAAKAGLESFTRSIAVQYGRDGVRCNCVSPGLVLSEQMDEISRQDPILKESFRRIDRNMLLREGHGSGKDVAYAVLFLASMGASYITGQTLIVDGGTIGHFPQWADLREAGVELG